MAQRKTKGKPNEVDIYAGQKLKYYRQCEKLSQDKLGKAVGVTFQQIQKYESGLNRMGAGRLYSIAKALDIPIACFFPDNNGIHKVDELSLEIDKLKEILRHIEVTAMMGAENFNIRK